MVIFLNGQKKKLDQPMTIRELLKLMDLREERIAVEVNLEIIDRSHFDRVALKEGDQVEVINFVGGGSSDRMTDPLKRGVTAHE